MNLNLLIFQQDFTPIQVNINFECRSEFFYIQKYIHINLNIYMIF